MDKTQLIEKIKNGVGLTHPATFHADDVLSTCLLRIINPNFKIIRSNVIPIDFPGLVYDIGMGEYDHHQADAQIRSDGTKYAAFGLLWRDLSYRFMSAANASVFDTAFVSEIDRCDNTTNTNLLSSSIGFFNPTWNSNENSDEQFERAVEIFTPGLRAMLYHFKKSTFVYRYSYDMDECLKIALENIISEKNQSISIPGYADVKDVWNYFYYLLTPNENPSFFERTFLNQINKTYGTYRTSPIILMLACMRKGERIQILEEIMKRRFFCINALDPARKECERIYQESKRKDIIILPKYMPYDSMTEAHESIKVVAFPTDRTGYTIMTANMNAREKESLGVPIKKVMKRIEFPYEIRGQKADVLERYCPGLFFVHPSGTMASCDKLENVFSFIEKVQK